MKWRSICSVTSKSAITPWRSGRVAEICAGVRPIIRWASAPTACDLARALVDRHHRRLGQHDAASAHVDDRVGGAQIDAMSRADRSTISDKGASRAGALGRCRLRAELPR